jgi:hypothetical protein
MPFGLKRTAACASHASRLVKCDVPKLRPDPCGSGAASAFPSVPPTKSGEIAHFKSDRPTRWRSYGGGLVTNPWEGLRTRLALACGFSSSRRPRQCALCTSHSVVARDFARCTTSGQVKIGARLCRSCGVCGFPVEMKGKTGRNSEFTGLRSECHSSVEQSETGESNDQDGATVIGSASGSFRSSARLRLAKDDTFQAGERAILIRVRPRPKI